MCIKRNGLNQAPPQVKQANPTSFFNTKLDLGFRLGPKNLNTEPEISGFSSNLTSYSQNIHTRELKVYKSRLNKRTR